MNFAISYDTEMRTYVALRQFNLLKPVQVLEKKADYSAQSRTGRGTNFTVGRFQVPLNTAQHKITLLNTSQMLLSPHLS